MKHFFTLFSMFFLVVVVKSQTVGVNSTGAVPATSAMLDVSATDKGLLVPRVDIIDLNTAAPITAPVTSLLVYNSNTTSGVGYFFWDGVKWTKLEDGNSNADNDWYEVGATTSPDAITDNMFTQGNVGIGVVSPSYPLDVSSSSNIGLSIESTDAVSRIRIIDVVSEVAIVASDEKMMFTTDGTLASDTKMTIDKVGKVGIGTITPLADLQVDQIENTVYDDVAQQLTGEGVSIRITNNSSVVGSFSQLVFTNRASTSGESRIVSINKGVNNTDLAFITENGTVLQEKMRITGDGNVGIGTVSPTQKLDVTGGVVLRASNTSYFWTERNDSDFDMIQRGGSTKRVFSIHPSVSGGDVLAVYTNNGSYIPAFHVKNTTGNVGVGTSTPAYQLQLTTNSAAKPLSNVWTVASDERLKTDIKTFEGGLEDVLKINPVWFTYTGEAGMPEDTGVGVLAQELQKVAPYMVNEWTYKESDNDEGESYLGVDNGAMTYMLINAIKELKKENDLLKNRLKKLEEAK